VNASSIPSGVIGGIVATLLLLWLASRAVRAARFRGGRYVVEYGLPVRVAGWFALALGVFIAYAASQASPDQRILAACVGGTLFLACLALFLEFHFVRIEFDDEFIYTFSPWRKRRVIPWSAVSGYSYSAVNHWHILETPGCGSIRLSGLLSGLGTMRDKWENNPAAPQTV
jgi:hypothetical protein